MKRRCGGSREITLPTAWGADKKTAGPGAIPIPPPLFFAFFRLFYFAADFTFSSARAAFLQSGIASAVAGSAWQSASIAARSASCFSYQSTGRISCGSRILQPASTDMNSRLAPIRKKVAFCLIFMVQPINGNMFINKIIDPGVPQMEWKTVRRPYREF